MLVAVADSVFPDLDPARAVLRGIDATLALAPEPTPEAIVRVAADADALLVTYARITSDMIARMTRCRIISRFGIGVERVDFADLLGVSDYISIHTPLVPETHGLFDDGAFRRMKPTAYIINTARGAIVDELALAEALDAGRLAGAALDVMPKEPPARSPLFGRANGIITPHTSFYSEESLVELQTKAAQEVVAGLTGQPPRNPVNPDVLRTV